MSRDKKKKERKKWLRSNTTKSNEHLLWGGGSEFQEKEETKVGLEGQGGFEQTEMEEDRVFHAQGITWVEGNKV